MRNRTNRLFAIAAAVALTVSASPTVGAQDASNTLGEAGGDAASIAIEHVLSGASVAPSTADDGVISVGSDVTSLLDDRQPVELVGLGRADLAVSDVVENDHNNTTNVYVQQRFGGIDILGAVVSVTVADEGDVLYAPGRLVANPESGVDVFGGDATPTLTAIAAAGRAAAALDLVPTEPFTVLDADDDVAQTQTLSGGGIANGTISARLVWDVVDDTTLRLAWDLMIDLPSGEHWWQIRIDADTGDELSRYDLVIHEPSLDDQQPAIGPSGDDASTRDGSGESFGSAETPNDLVADGSSYLVFDGESPDHVTPAGTRTTVNEPADDAASPFGWHDTNGVAGAESTLTTGNNVDAGTDIDGNNVIDAGSRPDGGAGLDFTPPLNLANDPTTYRPAVVTNLFYWNNRTHDFLYRYGFNEAAGNFQANNYGRGGLGGDAVSAQAQDDYNNGTRNNANFGTPPDGFMPRMQMYVFDAPTPDRDSSFDVGVVAHEYAHGLSNRLTGGPSRADCLRNDEQMGEGWSDIIALLMTMQGGTAADRTRGSGTYVLNQPTTGPGIRGNQYTTDLATNPWTYDTIKTTGSSPHALGAVWAQMLWEMNWALIDAKGFSPDLVGGSGGNNIAAQLIVDGLKIQPCAPGFVDGRNAILQADAINNNGANTCTIWKAFAKRGLGAGAQQGSSSLRTDGTQSFTMPASCSVVSLSAPDDITAGATFTYNVHVRNDEASAMPGVVLETPIPAGTTYVPASATCNGTLEGSKLVMTIFTVPANASATCSFNVTAAADLGTTAFLDDFTSIANWNLPAGAGTNTWAVRANLFPEPGEVSASTPASVSDQYLVMKNAVPLSATSQFRLNHIFGAETGFDGGVVEISVNSGATWQDLGPRFVNGGYVGTISAVDGSPIAGRMAFTGGAYNTRSTANLGDLAGNNALIRLRLTSDASVGTAPNVAWVLFDAAIGAPDAVVATTTMTVCGGATTSASARSGVDGAPVPGATPAPPALPSAQSRCPITAPTIPGAPTGVVATAGNAAAALSWTAPANTGGSPITGYLIEKSTNAGAAWTTAIANTASNATTATVTGLAGGVPIVFRVSAINAIGTGPPSAPSAAVTPTGTASAVSSLAPERFVDTRPTGATLDDRFEADGKRAANSEYRVQIAGRGGVPNGAKAAVMYVTAVAPEGTGFITVHPCITPLPVASSLNYTQAVNLGNEIIAPLTASGEVCLYTSAAAHLTVDVVGFIDANSPTTPVTPARFLDTRPGGGTFDNIGAGGTKPAAGSTTRLQVAGRGNIPADARVVIINVTAIGAEATGYLTAHACLPAPPNAASLNYVAGVNRANELIVNLNASGELCLFSFAALHLAADVVGYIPNPSSLTTVTPARLLDTRPTGDTIDDSDQATGKRTAGSTYTLQITGRAGVPATATAAVIYITAVAPEGVGYVTVHPCSATPPNTASLNHVAAVNGGNEIIAKLDPAGRICIFTSANTHLTADVVAHLT